MELYILSPNILIITAYISTTSNISYFLNNIEADLNHVYNNTVYIMLCGYFSIKYLSDNRNKQGLNFLLFSYSLRSIMDFPTIIHNSFNTMIYIMFIKILKIKIIQYIL